MARTDVHRPWSVQVADPYNRHLLYRYARWPWETALTSYKNLGCGCSMCTGKHFRREARRRSRHQARHDCRRAAVQAAAGDLDPDWPAPPRRLTW